MSHLRIELTENKGDYRLASYEISKYAFTRAVLNCKKNPEEDLRNYLCSWYCFDPRITPDDLIEYKLMNVADNSDVILVHLHLKPKP